MSLKQIIEVPVYADSENSYPTNLKVESNENITTFILEDSREITIINEYLQELFVLLNKRFKEEK